MHVWFPDHRALCMAENATHVLHNVLTIRGAQVRDARAWAGYLTEAIDLYGGDLEVAFASHHWPTWGRERAVEFLALQRDLYAYLHDQTLRLLNRGLTGPEIAEVIELPPALQHAWHARGYYGSVSHNVKAIYQRYMGWYDGNPAHLWPHPPEAAARRYVDFMGGAEAVVARAQESFAAGDFRWVAEVLNHVVFAEPEHALARALLADTYEQLGYGAENGTWRCAYLSGAAELRSGAFGTPVGTLSADVLAQLTPEQLFDALAVRVDGPRCWDEHLTIDVDLSDEQTRHRLTLRNGVLTHTSAPQPTAADVVLRLPRAALPAVLAGSEDADGLARSGVDIEGDAAVLGRLLGMLEAPDPDFAIVTP
jgi:alkyl sulfatase BDS1-like metallo-beta-lactamase superfamily hydrolase